MEAVTESASIFSLVLTITILHKIKSMNSAREKTEYMMHAMTDKNKYYHAGLNMEIDILSDPLDKLNEIRAIINNYNKVFDKLSDFVENENRSELFCERKIARVNMNSRLKLLLLALEIQIMELEVANMSCPLPDQLERINAKRDEFQKVASATGYAD